MKLYCLDIQGFRRLYNTKVLFSDATFLIGQNNVGKTSILAALDYLLSDTKTIAEQEYFQVCREGNTNNERLTNEIILTAEFRNVPSEALTWRGFKGRVLRYEVLPGSSETGLSIIYRKTFQLGQNVTVQLKEFKRTMNAAYSACKTLNDYVAAGLNLELVREYFGDTDLTKNLTAKQQQVLPEIDDLWDIDENEESWFTNPGGIPGVVLEKLPRFLLIPAQDKMNEITESSGTLMKTLEELFTVVRESSENYQRAQEYLSLLAAELDPSLENSEFGKMMNELNDVLGEVFPESKISAKASLTDPNKSLKPIFVVKMSSNIETSVHLQGTGMIRSAVFALLRYRNIFENNRRPTGLTVRPLLIGFEEPEIYLHPNAANQMRDVIYDLAGSEFNQIICTTHSPYMIDLSQKPAQVLNNLSLEEINGIVSVKAYPFSTSLAFMNLLGEDKDRLKMLLKIDDYIARAFFSEKVLIVEGNTEDIVLRETISRMPEKVRLDVISKWQIIKATGKSTIISLVKYLVAMNIRPFVIHDEDGNTPGAVIFNQPIADALGDPTQHIMLHNCIEDVLGYQAPTREKPLKAYSIVKAWGPEWDDVPQGWRTIMEQVFNSSFLLENRDLLLD